MTRKLRNSIIAACAGAILAACGGGSSGSAPATTSTGNGSDLAGITLDNAELTAGAVAGVALGDGVFGAMAGLQLPAIPGATGAILTEVAKISRSSQLMASSSAVFDCTVSGTVDIDITVANALQPTEGDVYALQFAACDEGTGSVVDGGMIITITELDGDFDSGEFLLGVSMQLSAFQVTEGGETTGANGAVTVAIDSRTPPLTTITVSTSSLATSSAGAAEAVTDLTVTISEDSVFPVAVSVDTSFTLSSPRIGGDVSVTTSLTLEASGDEYPYVGELRITGAGNSAIVLIALDPTRVRLEIDLDGDGAFDEVLETTWDELLAAAA